MFKFLKNFFNSAVRVFRGFIKRLFRGALETILAQLKDIALKTVTDLAETDLSNEKKRAEAFKRISEYAKKQGIAAGDSIINLAIELAVQALKKGIQ